MPEGAVYVGRPTKWGNPFAVGAEVEIDGGIRYVHNRSIAAWLFRVYCEELAATEELRGKDLVCWCPLDEPCHADVLLEWANG